MTLTLVDLNMPVRQCSDDYRASSILGSVKVRLRVPVVDDPDLIVEMSHGEIAVLRLVGSADTTATKPLGMLLDQIHEELLERKTPELVLDMRSLDHMGAPCLRQMLAWINRQGEAEERYRIRIRIQPTLPWQQNLQALSCFDTTSISVES